MNPFQISSGLVNFQTLVFRYDEDTIMVVSKELQPNFQSLATGWKQKYKCKGGTYSSMEMDGIELTNEQAEKFFEDYPKLKRQLKMNEEHGYSIWVKLPEGLSKEDVDLIHSND